MGENGTATAATKALMRQGAEMERSEFNAREIAPVVETASVAMAARARAEVEARVVLALKRPRDFDVVRRKLLDECGRTRFAEAARYAKPQGKKKNDQTGVWEQQYVRGWTARFAEAAARVLGNVYINAAVIFDDQSKRVVSVTAMDLETNATQTVDVTIEKTIERRELKKGQVAVRTRHNSYGDIVHVVEATDDEVIVKQNSAISKARRNLVMMLTPADLLEDCLDKVTETLASEEDRDPKAARKRVVDAFASVGVQPDQLKEYLGHDIDSCSPAEAKELRELFASVRDGETTWTEVMAARTGERTDQERTTTPATEPPKTTDDIKARHAAKKAKTEPAAREPGTEG